LSDQKKGRFTIWSLIGELQVLSSEKKRLKEFNIHYLGQIKVTRRYSDRSMNISGSKAKHSHIKRRGRRIIEY